MSTGQNTQATTTQGSRGTVAQDAPNSALFYLFQEVSRLGSPVHGSFLDPSSPSVWLDETSKQESSINKEEDGAHLFQTFNGVRQHSLPLKLPCQGKNGKEESHCSNTTTLVEPNYKCSPWKVLSLINLQCERLLCERDVKESDSGSGSSITKLCPLTAKSSATADVTEQEVGSDTVNAEYTPRPSVGISKREEASVGHVEDVSRVCGTGTTNYQPQPCVKGSKMDCIVQPQNMEKPETVMSVGNTTAPSRPQHGDIMEVRFGVGKLEWSQECKKEQEFLSDPCSSINALSQAHIPNSLLTTHLTFKSHEDTSVALSKSALPLDHNANVDLSTEALCDYQIPASPSFRATEGCFLHPRNDNKIPECTHVSTEQKSTPAEQLKSSSYCEPQLRSVEREDISHSSSQQWRTKTPRKQPHPSRSVDIQDPDFQGVTFSMHTELDDSREQCRLLITSKYSREFCKSVRKPRLRTRTSQKPLKTSSSEEESDPTTSVSKDKVCASCCTRKTPMWRDAEDGTPLCNACGIRYKKYRVRCVNCWHIPRKEGNSNSCCLKCGNLVRLFSTQRKHTA